MAEEHDKTTRRYPRPLLLHLSKSPLVSCPGLPALSKWYGDYEAPHTPHHKPQELPRERGVRGERNVREEGKRERPRERETRINGEAQHDPAQPFGAMGDFRLPRSAAKRPERDIKEEGSSYERGGSETYRPNGHWGGGPSDAFRPARDKEREIVGRKQGRAEEGGWRTGKILSERAHEPPARRNDDGRRDRDTRREHEPAWMDDEPLPGARNEAESSKKVSAWSKGPPAASASTSEPLELGGHVDMLQAFKAQMRAKEAKEKEGPEAEHRATTQSAPPAGQAHKPHEDHTPSIPKQSEVVSPSAAAADSASLPPPGLTSAPTNSSHHAPASASSSKLGLDLDPAITSVSGFSSAERPKEREVQNDGGDDSNRPRASRFAKFFKPEPAMAKPVSSGNTLSPIAAVSSPPVQTQPEQRTTSAPANASNNADQESFRRLMDMLQMSATPLRQEAKSSGPLPNNFSPPAHSFSPPTQPDVSHRQQYGLPGAGMAMHQQRVASTTPMPGPSAFAAHQPLPPSQPGYAQGPSRPPGLPQQIQPNFGGLHMPFNGQHGPPPGFNGMRPGYPYAQGPPMPHQMSPPPLPPASSAGADSLLAMFSQAGR